MPKSRKEKKKGDSASSSSLNTSKVTKRKYTRSNPKCWVLMMLEADCDGPEAHFYWKNTEKIAPVTKEFLCRINSLNYKGLNDKDKEIIDDVATYGSSGSNDDKILVDGWGEGTILEGITVERFFILTR